MIIAVVGSGGKTSYIHELAQKYINEGKKVFVTTSTHMFAEQNTIISDDSNIIINELQNKGYCMAGNIDNNYIGKKIKIKSLSDFTFVKVCNFADVVLVEADGSRGLPIKFPNKNEPVIPENTDEIHIIAGLSAIGKKFSLICHRKELAKNCLKIDDDTVISLEHIKKLVYEGYFLPLKIKYPKINIKIFFSDFNQNESFKQFDFKN